MIIESDSKYRTQDRKCYPDEAECPLRQYPNTRTIYQEITVSPDTRCRQGYFAVASDNPGTSTRVVQRSLGGVMSVRKDYFLYSLERIQALGSFRLSPTSEFRALLQRSGQHLDSIAYGLLMSEAIYVKTHIHHACRLTKTLLVTPYPSLQPKYQ
ncbi:hypothetical protein AVEN_93755-1 [Araneus ventricosus]|uniref:Uncharacterized protein n=1 Tax=Araneus ventricosus TaxID=182803 RepID=A0A4Y2JUM9_ARAVE|nr:hypothetical protein AVEN_93755-1 [Araneus ventricosus]